MRAGDYERDSESGILAPRRRGVLHARPQWMCGPALLGASGRIPLSPGLVVIQPGQQLVDFSRASTATYIDASGVLQTAGVNVPRYQGGALLVEAAATNLLTYSSQFDNAAWTKISTTVTTNTDVAPDGTTTMDTLLGTNAVTSYIKQIVTGLTAGAIYDVSVFVKAGSSPGSFLAIYDSSISTLISRAQIAWSGGVPSLGVVNGTWNTTPTFTEVGTTGIYRVSGSFNTGTFAGVGVLIYPASANTADTLKVWGFQLEAGPVATSYIPTTSASATRAADTGFLDAN